MPIHPDNRWLTGMLWDGTLFIDTALPFGLRSAPKISTALGRVDITESWGKLWHPYLDNFLIIGAPDSPECSTALRIEMETFARLGFPLAINKLDGPTTCLDFLNFELVELPTPYPSMGSKAILHTRRGRIPHWPARTHMSNTEFRWSGRMRLGTGGCNWMTKVSHWRSYPRILYNLI